MILPAKREEFCSLFSEFAESYLATRNGEVHQRFYGIGRSRGRENFAAIKASHGDITDSVLRGLLPHTDSAAPALPAATCSTINAFPAKNDLHLLAISGHQSRKLVPAM